MKTMLCGNCGHPVNLSDSAAAALAASRAECAPLDQAVEIAREYWNI